MIEKTKLSPFQLFFILIHSQIGVGIITLPYDVFLKADGDAWLSILLTGILVQIMLFLFWLLIRRFPTNNLYEIAQKLFGKVIGKGFIFLYCIYFICIASVVLANYAYFLKAWMMPMTPKWILVALMAFIAVYAVKENIQIVARFTVISSVIFIAFLAAAAYALKDANVTHVLPIGVKGVMPIIKGTPTGLFSFQGFEILLILYPIVQAKPKEILKVASYSNAFVTLFYSFLVLVSLMFFSPKELKVVPEPVLYLVKSFSFRVIERPDLVFTSMWIVLVATTLMCNLYASSKGLSTIMQTKKIGKHAWIIIVICFFGGMNFTGIYEIESVSEFVNHYLIPIFYSLPILLLVLSIIFNKREEVKEE